MVVTLLVDPQLFEVAAAAATRVGTPGQLVGLRAPLQGATLGRLEEAWDAVFEVVRKGFECGADQVSSVLEAAWDRVNEVMASAGDMAHQLKDYLLERIRQFITVLVDGLLKNVRSEITLGGSVFYLNQVQLKQKLVITGSLKASVEEIISFATNGEIEVETSYGPTHP